MLRTRRSAMRRSRERLHGGGVAVESSRNLCGPVWLGVGQVGEQPLGRVQRNPETLGEGLTVDVHAGGVAVVTGDDAGLGISSSGMTSPMPVAG